VARLIVNADDFGLTAGINRAIAELHAAGAVTSASLIARAPATDEAIEIARATPSLAVGCHVVLVDGAPVLSPTHEIPHLAVRFDGRFRSSLFDFLVWLHGLGSDGYCTFDLRAEEIEAEAGAQISLLENRGVHLTHIDAHKHVHLFPAVLRPVLRAAKSAGILVVRNPFEPRWSLHATSGAPWPRRIEVGLLRCFESAFRRVVAEEGFVTTDGCIGVAATGRLDAGALTTLLGGMPDGTWELVTHPGYNDADLARAHTRLLASREIERQALLGLRGEAGIDLISFAALERRPGQ